MLPIPSIVVGVATALSNAPGVPACDLVDLAGAVTVLGEGAALVSDTSVEDVCMYQGADNWALLTVQNSSAEFYDMATIPQPHTPESIGDRGRSNVDGHGQVAIQFVKGDDSVTISVRIFSERDVDVLGALREIAVQAAGRMP